MILGLPQANNLVWHRLTCTLCFANGSKKNLLQLYYYSMLFFIVGTKDQAPLWFSPPFSSLSASPPWFHRDTGNFYYDSCLWWRRNARTVVVWIGPDEDCDCPFILYQRFILFLLSLFLILLLLLLLLLLLRLLRLLQLEVDFDSNEDRIANKSASVLGWALVWSHVMRRGGIRVGAILLLLVEAPSRNNLASSSAFSVQVFRRVGICSGAVLLLWHTISESQWWYLPPPPPLPSGVTTVTTIPLILPFLPKDVWCCLEPFWLSNSNVEEDNNGVGE